MQLRRPTVKTYIYHIILFGKKIDHRVEIE